MRQIETCTLWKSTLNKVLRQPLAILPENVGQLMT